jgi:dihydroflavonol-4-reductase
VHAVNVDGTRNLLEASRAAGVRRFVHFSSIHAFRAEPLDEPLDETRSLVGASGFAYDRSKADSDRLVQAAVNSGLDAVVIHPTSVLGPCDHEPSLLGRTLIRMATGRMPILVPGGYNWVDVRDVVSAAVASLERGVAGERYLVGGHWVSLRNLATRVALVAGCRPPLWTAPMWLARFGIPFSRAYGWLANSVPVFTREALHTVEFSHRDIRTGKARRHLGYEPRAFESTIEDTISWFRDAGFLDRHNTFPTPRRPARCSTCSSMSGLAFPS